MDLRTLPTVELHPHLDCSLSYDVVHRLAPEMSVPGAELRPVANGMAQLWAQTVSRPPPLGGGSVCRGDRMNKRKKVAWHKHLKARRMAEAKRKAETATPTTTRRTR
jgi:hypothetical protein